MAYQHQTLTAGGWSELSFAEQMGNIGSETSRMLKAGDDHTRFGGAFSRGLELLDLTIGDPRWHGRLAELIQVREKLVRAAHGGKENRAMLEDLDKYFFEFAYAARAGR